MSGGGSSPRSISDMELSATSGGIRLRLSTADSAELLVYRVDPNGNLTLVETDLLPTGGIAAEELCAITVGGTELLVAIVPLSAGLSQLVAFDPATGQSYSFTDAGARVTSVAVVTVAGREVVYVAYADGSSIDRFERGPDGNFAAMGAVSSEGGAGVVGLQVVTVAGQTLLIASDCSGEIRSFGVSPDGSLTLIDSEGSGEGLGMGGPSEAECVTLAGATYLIQAATGSSSLSVIRIEADGSLTPTDHVIDNLNTRFQSVTAMDTVTIDGRVYVIAGGADGGISLFVLLPGGTLYHLGTIQDTASTTLSAINSIEAVVTGSSIQVFVSSGDSAGFTQITLTPGPAGTTAVGTGGANVIAGSSGDDVLSGGAGADQITGGSGDDFLLDGPGADTLTGGSGADVFVLSFDQEVDVILDFDRTRDRLDLSAIPMLRSADQLQITPMPWGARIVCRGDTLDIHTADGMPLTAAQIAGLGVVNLDHYMGLEVLLGRQIEGTDGDDVLEGTQMQDSLSGRMGNDILRGRGGGDYLDGAGGRDFADYSQVSSAVTVDLADASQNAGAAQGDTLIGIEGVIGTALADVLRGDAAANFLIGEGGNDRIYGGAGSDEIYGGDGNDRLSGDAGADLIDGGAGRDYADFSASSQAVTLDFLRPELNTGEATGDVYIAVEGAIGGDGRDTLRGDNAANYMFGGGNEDV
ncbi:MAG: hypothetical protein OEM24_09915, partial [Paracoccaceae bacterium]|nr:hypothetical protein [Paracoccaceae bacterium]